MKTNTDVTTNIRRGKKLNHNIYEKFLSRMEKKLWGPCKKHYFAKLKVDDKNFYSSAKLNKVHILSQLIKDACIFQYYLCICICNKIISMSIKNT